VQGLDTNVLVRYLTQDAPRQSAAAARFIERECTGESPGFVSHVVLCELVWVLAGAYGCTKRELLQALEGILRVTQLRVEDPERVWRALSDFRSDGADFSDHLIAHAGLAAGCETTATFDRAAAKAPGFALLR